MGCAYSRTCIGEICAPREAKTREAQNAKAQEFPVFSPGSSNVQEGEVRDELNQLSLTRDAEVGITRLSRVSAQFLPPDGSRTVKVPSGKYELRYSYLSQRGYYPDALDKANQDSFCIHTPFGTSPDDHFFGVFDGHGECGAQCSQFVKKKLCENLLRHGKFREDTVEACHSSFLTTNSQLHTDILDDTMSGTTAITILVRGRTLYVANCGDSRAVIAERRGNDIVAVDLSMDQTPFREDECERVKLCGARVLTLDQIEGLKNPDVKCWGTEEGDDGDPPRLWVPNGMYPGTAFTRSIGDSIAETIGVSAIPEIVVLELTPSHPFFVLASDGVFEFISSQTVVDMVAKHKDPRDACAAIVAESYRLWLQYETRTDDITVIVVHVNGLTEAAGTRLASPGGIIRSPVPQVVEVTGAESPSTLSRSWRNHRTRNDLSKARLRAIESSLENGQVWAPPPPINRKTWEEEAHIEQALQDHFLFRKLTDSQCHVLLDSMKRVEVQPGDVVVEQGGEGDCFYVVGSGEFEVSATQEDKDGATTRVLHRYTADKLSSFGELALMSNKPLQASVRACTSGTLWALKREDFRGILMSEFTNLSSLKLLRSVDLLSKLTILQLSQIADSLSEISFSDGQSLFDKNEGPGGLHIIQKGGVKLTFPADTIRSPNVCSLKCDDSKDSDGLLDEKEIMMEKSEGSYFGEWVLLGQQLGPLGAVAVGDVTCALLTKVKFDSVVGPLAKLWRGNEKETNISLDDPNGSQQSSLVSTSNKVDIISSLEWRKCLHATDYCEIGLVSIGDSENCLTLKRFSKFKVKQLAKEEQVLKEKKLMKIMNPSAFVPRIVCTSANKTHACILLNTCLACSLDSILHKPLDDTSAKFIATCAVIALENLHESGILFRGVSANVLMLDKSGYLQIVDIRFGKTMSGERTFTICGMADFLAPEIVQGRGHGFPADWWALGVLVYYMLRGEMPFGLWRQNELDTVAKISKGQVSLPQTLAPDAADFITKLLEVDESKRLGSEGGSHSVKGHPWFSSVDWTGIEAHSFPVPPEITSRITQHTGSILEEFTIPPPPPPPPPVSPSRDLEEFDIPGWLEDW